MTEEIKKEENQKKEVETEINSEKKEEIQQEIEDIEKLKAELKKCLAEKEEYLNGWKRAKADFINYKKEEARQQEIWSQMIVGALIKELLTVLDSFRLGLNMLPDDEKIKKGWMLINSQLEDILKKYGLKKIPVEIGKPFDPKTQEAFLEEFSEKYPEGSVLEEIESGYFLNGNVLRPAKVKIVKTSKD